MLKNVLSILKSLLLYILREAEDRISVFFLFAYWLSNIYLYCKYLLSESSLSFLRVFLNFFKLPIASSWDFINFL